jgi:GT2 family glycosyltransferase
MTLLPRVSVVTPSFNQAPFLEETIQSVLSQDYPNIEYIIMDGGSTDGSVDIVKRYASRLSYWVSEPDGGQPDALRKGFARASGEVLAWLNSDDVYFPGAVSLAVAAFRDSPSVGVVSGGCRIMTSTGNRLRDIPARHVSLLDQLWGNDIRQPSTFFLRTAYSAVGGLDETFHYSMDYDLWLKLLTITELRTVPELLASFRLHGSSKTVAQQSFFFLEDLRAVEHYLNSSAGQALAPALRRRTLIRRLLLCLESAADDAPIVATVRARLTEITPRLTVEEIVRAMAGIFPSSLEDPLLDLPKPERAVEQMPRRAAFSNQVMRSEYRSLARLVDVGVLSSVQAASAQWQLRLALLLFSWDKTPGVLQALKRAVRLLTVRAGAPRLRHGRP